MSDNDNIVPFAENAGRKQRGKPFTKGQSGNPKGKAPGTRHRTTTAALALLAGQAEQLTQKAVALALDGDSVCLRLCIDRIIPIVRERTLPSLDLPPIKSKADLATLHQTLLDHLSTGVLTVSEANALFAFATAGQQLIEETDPAITFAQIIAGALAASPPQEE